MLVPAVLYKDEIQKIMKAYYYTEDMMYMTGSLDNWNLNISDCPDDKTYQYAIVSNDKLIGYFGYSIDWYSDCAYNFGVISFDRGNPIIGKNVFNRMEKLVARHHRVEWRMVGGNPIEESYDKFCEKHYGNKYVLKDRFKDREGNYHDDIIYEILNQ